MSTIVGDDGQPIVDARGVDLRLTESWREILRHVDEETVIWARSFRKMYGTKSDMAEAYVEDEEGLRMIRTLTSTTANPSASV